MLKQVSIYAENKKGTIQNITGLLAEKNINILGSVINDGAEYGIIRMIVSDPESAAEALYDSNVNATYIYLSFNRESGKPIMVFHTEDISEVESCLESKGFSML